MPWWRAFGDRGALPAVLRIWRGDALVAGLAMATTGRRLAAMSNVHTPLLTPLFADPAALAALADAVARRGAGHLRLAPLERTSAATTAFAGAARAHRRLVLCEATYQSPVVDTTGSFDEYRSRMRGGWKTLERRGRKAAREHQLVVRAVERPADGVGFLEEGLRVEASGWKRQAGTAIVSRPDTAAFYREMAAGFARSDMLALSGLWLDERLVAFDLALLHANRYWMLKTGYDEDYRHLSPGLVLRRAVIERCFALGLETHELLGADQPWKRTFATGTRAHATCHGFRRLPGPVAELGWRRVRPGVRALYHRMPRAAGPGRGDQDRLRDGVRD